MKGPSRGKAQGPLTVLMRPWVTAVCLDIIILFSFLEQLLFLSKLLSCIVSSRQWYSYILHYYFNWYNLPITKRSRYSSLESITSLYSFQCSFSKNKNKQLHKMTPFTPLENACAGRKKFKSSNKACVFHEQHC